MSGKKFELQVIPIKDLKISRLNVRKINKREGINELAESIRKIGLQQPIVVIKKGEIFEVIIGQRRYYAAIEAGLAEIPAIIRSVSSDREAIIASFSENIHRQDLEYEDKMEVAERLLSELGSISEVAASLGVTETTVRNYLGYTMVPKEVKKMVEQRDLSATTAIRISRAIGDANRVTEIAKLVKETPRGKDRDRIINIAKENPRSTTKDIKEIVRKTKFSSITIDLTPRVSEALENASEKFRSSRNDIALEALIIWLNEKGFLK